MDRNMAPRLEHVLGDTWCIVTGTKRNVQVLVEYLQESGRLDIRARDGFLEYIRT